MVSLLSSTAAPQSAGAPPVKSALSTAIAQPVQEGRRARRGLVLTPTTPPTVGEEVELRIEPEGTRDLFHNPLTSTFSMTFTWPDPAGAGVVVTDAMAPAVDELRLRDGYLEIGFSEPPNSASASAAIEVDGQPVTWVEGDDGYSLRTSAPVAEGTHTVRVASGAAVDRAGKGPVATFEETFTVLSGEVDKEIHVVPDAHEVPPETFAARLSFHGRPLDLETGFLYFRNRYFDPELGRFITADPLGYVDGPSMYQFAGYSPGDYGDPLGLFNSVAFAIGMHNIFQELMDLPGDSREESFVRLYSQPWRYRAKIEESLAIHDSALELREEGTGPTVFDEYSILVAQIPKGMTPYSFVEAMATDLNQTVSDPIFSILNKFNRRSQSAVPVVGEIYDINIIGPDNVVVMGLGKRFLVSILSLLVASRKWSFKK